MIKGLGCLGFRKFNKLKYATVLVDFNPANSL